jgi:hypothetical protein
MEESKKPHYDVVIATPGKMLHSEYVSSLVKTLRWLGERGETFTFLSVGSSFIPSGREQTATGTGTNNWDTREVGSGQFTYGKIFWIDSDIEWGVEDFKKIYHSELDIVSGVYLTNLNGTIAANKYDAEGRPNTMNEKELFMIDEPLEVGGVGFGFVAMKQGVFEKMDRPWFKIEHVKWSDLDFECNVGEDYSWCMNAQRNGFKVMLDPNVKVKHHKEVIWEVP